jgi:hypothetical protein
VTAFSFAFLTAQTDDHVSDSDLRGRGRTCEPVAQSVVDKHPMRVERKQLVIPSWRVCGLATCGLPSMWQLRGNVIGPVCRQTREDVLEIRVLIVAIELRGTGQADDRSATLSCSQQACK